MGSLPHSFSGQDFNIWAYLPDINKAAPDVQPVVFGNIQTITTSMAVSLAAVQSIGTTSILDITEGSKTFAGTIVFSVLDKDPFQEFIRSSELSTGTDKLGIGNDFFTIDMLPAFNVVIQGSNEYLPRELNRTLVWPDKIDIYKIIVGIKLFTYGETISIDDFFTEQTYQYRARYVSHWKAGTPSVGASMLNLSDKESQVTMPDEIAADRKAALEQIQRLQSSLKVKALYDSIP